HVGHPEREEVVRAPVLVAQRGEVLIGEPVVVGRAHVRVGVGEGIGHRASRSSGLDIGRSRTLGDVPARQRASPRFFTSYCAGGNKTQLIIGGDTWKSRSRPV